MEVLTYPKAKDAEQVVAIKTEGQMNLRLFDAVSLFMTDDTWVHRKMIFDSGKPREFAEQFVAQFNSPALSKATHEAREE